MVHVAEGENYLLTHKINDSKTHSTYKAELGLTLARE